MEPRRKSEHRTASAKRTKRCSPGPEMVRASSIFPSKFTRLGPLVAWIANLYAGPVGPRAGFTAWQMMPPWRRLACHILPVICALGVTYAVIELFGDRYDPRVVLEHQVVPQTVEPGQIAAQEIRAYDERNCQGINRRWIVDSGHIIYDMSDIPVFQHVENDHDVPFTFVHEFQVPVGITPGKATIHSRTDRWCNIFQEFFWPISVEYSEQFTVVKPQAQVTSNATGPR